MKTLTTILFALAAIAMVLVVMIGANDVFGQSLDLRTVAASGHSVQRVDHPDGDVHVTITIALTQAFAGSNTYRTDFCLTAASGEAATAKSGTAAERTALRKKYVRATIAEYLTKKAAAAPAANTDQGSTAITKAAIIDVGDQ